MSYTTNKQPQGVPLELSNFLRQATIGELVAINEYQKHISYCSIPDVRKLLEHIMLDEKKHYGMLLHMTRKCDPDQFAKAIDVHENTKIKHKTLHEDLSKKKNCDISFLEKIREDIKGELEAIISYEEVITKISDTEAIEMIKQIVRDEKEHVEELTYLLLKLDNNCYGPIEKDF